MEAPVRLALALAVGFAAAPTQAALIQNHVSGIDGTLVTLDPVNELEIMPFPATRVGSVNDVLAGAGGFLAAGWRYATTAQVCAVALAHAPVLMSVCPGQNTVQWLTWTPGSISHDPEKHEVLALVRNLGMTSPPKLDFGDVTDTRAYYDDGPGTQSYAIFSAGGSGDDRSQSWRILAQAQAVDNLADSFFLSGRGFVPVSHFLVRSLHPIPEPAPALLALLGLAGLAATARRARA